MNEVIGWKQSYTYTGYANVSDWRPSALIENQQNNDLSVLLEFYICTCKNK